MKITVLDSLAATREILDAPAADRPALIRRMRSPMDGMYPFIPGGPDQFAMHEGTFGFPVEGADEQLRVGLGSWSRRGSGSAWQQGSSRRPGHSPRPIPALFFPKN